MAFEWWQTGVVYQIYPRSFQDTNGDGIGDLRGIQRRLDYIADLGVDAIWISPIFRSPMADFGYDVADYCDVDPVFGSIEDADQLIAAAHDRNLRVILDFVPSHSSDRHAWFHESRKSKLNPKRDWYVWRDPDADGQPPNNWLSVFGGSAWELDELTGQFYRHTFLKEQPDLNWRNPEVLDALDKVLKFWMDRGVDGFRLDAVLFGMKDPGERDNPPASQGTAHKAMGAWDSQTHVYDAGHEDIHAVFARWRKLVDSHLRGRSDVADDLYVEDRSTGMLEQVLPPGRCLIGEIHEYDLKRWQSYFGDSHDELHLPCNFGLLKTPFTSEAVRKHVEEIEQATDGRGWPTYVLGNHDEKRLATRLGRSSDRLAAMLLLTLRGTPTLYYGDEIGMEDSDIPEDRIQDPWVVNDEGLTRDGCRTPMQWDSSPRSGFTDGLPWLPVASEAAFRNVAVQSDEPGSLLNLYRRLLRLRKKHQALHRGSFSPVDAGAEDCFSFLREAPDAPGHFKRLFVALNFGDEPAHVVLPGPGRVLLWSHAPGEDKNLVEMVRLGPKEGAIAVLFA